MIGLRLRRAVPRVSRRVLIGALVAGIASCGALLLLTLAPPLAPPNGGPVASSSSRVEPATRARKPAPPAFVALPEPTPYSRQLLGALCRLEQPSVPQTPEQVAAWKQNLQQLIAQGPSAVAAIREFLEKHVDLDFGPGNSLGHASARAAMFDALVQIGGAEGLSGTLQTLQDTADPREIALLAQNLERLAPGEYRQEAIEAARDALALATGGKLEGADVAPLFEVLNKFGDTSVVTDLLGAAKQWNYYSAIALSRLPDGAGIPTLIEMAEGKSGGRLNALEMLAQMSAQYPDARAALIEQARANKISPNMWPYLAPLLAGDLYHYQDSAFEGPKGAQQNGAHVVLGNQRFYTAPATDILTAEEIDQRLALIAELESLASDPSARKALERSRELLRNRDPQILAASQ